MYFTVRDEYLDVTDEKFISFLLSHPKERAARNKVLN